MSSTRYPPIKPSTLNTEQRSMIDAHFKAKCETKDENDALLGPFAVLFRKPSLARAWFDLGRDGNELLTVSPAVRGTAILAVGSVFIAEHELYFHTNVATQATYLTGKQVSLTREGKKPGGEDKLDAACEMAFDMGIALGGRPGPLSQEVWNRACETVGQESTLALIRLIAHYANTCILLNAAGIRAPPVNLRRTEHMGVSEHVQYFSSAKMTKEYLTEAGHIFFSR